jgi:hypothetical protein
VQTRWTWKEQLCRATAHLLSFPLYLYLYVYVLGIAEPWCSILTALTLQAFDALLRWIRRRRLEKDYRDSPIAF